MSINEMFEQGPAKQAVRRLEGSDELYALADNAAIEALKAMEPNISEYRDRIVESFKSGDDMDRLVDELIDLDKVCEQAQFLLTLPEETVSNILRSVQSKRSRLRAKDTTLDTYRSLLGASVAETVLRRVCNKPKTHSGPRSTRRNGIDYTQDELEAFTEDQEALKRAIRNVQSKKSIYKRREDFSEDDPQYQQILKVEQQLKSLRVSSRNNTVVEVDKTKDALAELLSGIDLQHIKAADSKALLSSISELLSDDSNEADTLDDDPANEATDNTESTEA